MPGKADALRQWAMPAIAIGGLALGGVAAWYNLEARVNRLEEHDITAAQQRIKLEATHTKDRDRSDAALRAMLDEHTRSTTATTVALSELSASIRALKEAIERNRNHSDDKLRAATQTLDHRINRVEGDVQMLYPELWRKREGP